MRPRPSKLAPLLALALLGLVPAGCEKPEPSQPPEARARDRIETLSLQLLEALRDSDRSTLAAITRTALQADLDARDLDLFARTLHWLGPMTLAQRGDDAAIQGGVRRSYEAVFHRGSFEFEVTVIADKLEGFHVDPQTWAPLVNLASEARAGSLRMLTFSFLGPEGQPLSDASFSDPARIDYSLAIEGLDSQLREHWLSVDKIVVDDRGRQVYRQPEPDEIRFPQADSGSAGGRITGSVAVPGPGKYTLVLDISDLVGAQSMTHTAHFEVEASPAKPD